MSSRARVEYDLTTMVDSKGGYIIAKSEDTKASLEQLQKKRRLESNIKFHINPSVAGQDLKCSECDNSTDLIMQYLAAFKVKVCHDCRKEHPDKYSLLTKTEVKQVLPVINRRTI